MQYSEIRNLLRRAALKYVTSEEAIYFADEAAETLVRKPESRLELLHDLKNWKSVSGKIVKDINLPGFTRYNFDGLSPSLKIKEIHDDLATKARIAGISMVSIVNSGGMHTLHFWTQGLAKRGLVALSTWNSMTNPISYALPSDTGNVVVEVATNEHADTRHGQKINHVLEIMTSALIGARASAQLSPNNTPGEHGGIIIAFDISMLTNRTDYNESVKALNDSIRDSDARVPGDSNLARLHEASDDTDIPLEEGLEQFLVDLTSA